MIIKTGLEPKVTSHIVPVGTGVAYDLGGRTYEEPLHNIEQMEIWVIHWYDEEGKRTSDFTLFTAQPQVHTHQFVYRESAERGSEPNRRHEEHYRREHDTPDDARVKREPTAAQHLNTVTISWWEVTVG